MWKPDPPARILNAQFEGGRVGEFLTLCALSAKLPSCLSCLFHLTADVAWHMYTPPPTPSHPLPLPLPSFQRVIHCGKVSLQ